MGIFHVRMNFSAIMHISDMCSFKELTKLSSLSSDRRLQLLSTPMNVGQVSVRARKGRCSARGGAFHLHCICIPDHCIYPPDLPIHPALCMSVPQVTSVYGYVCAGMYGCVCVCVYVFRGLCMCVILSVCLCAMCLG